MSNEDNVEVISKLLKLYPDVVANLGGESVVNTDDILKRITDYIEKHKWLINEKIPFTITLDQAFYSWYENVFFPQWHEMERTNILQKFRDKTPYDVYKMVSSEYFFLMEADRGVHYDKACYAVIARESKSIIAKFSAKMHLLSL